MAGHRRGPSWPRLLGLVVALVVAVAAGWWAARATFTSSQSDSHTQRDQVVVTVRQASVGQALNLNVTVTQAFVPLAPALLAGIVTQAPALSTATDGAVIYRVNDIPVRVVQGATPFYRALRPGTKGADVTELQQALISLGDLSGAPSGSFDAATTAAVKKWQSTLGQDATAMIALGELIAVPTLPTTLRLGGGVKLGAQLDSSAPAVLARTGQPTFTLIVSQQQAALIPSGATLQISFANHTWPAVISGSKTDPNDSTAIDMSLTSPTGGVPCAADCGALPPDDSVSLLAAIQVVPQTVGPAVPAAAVHTDPGGSTYVVMADGAHRPVTVKASANGLVIVGGVNPGDAVLALGGGASNGLPAAPVSGPEPTK
jgi:peptidoglycan hydrolase-like protein with peptidoglycan-binding domain